MRRYGFCLRKNSLKFWLIPRFFQGPKISKKQKPAEVLRATLFVLKALRWLQHSLSRPVIAAVLYGLMVPDQPQFSLPFPSDLNQQRL